MIWYVPMGVLPSDRCLSYYKAMATDSEMKLHHIPLSESPLTTRLVPYPPLSISISPSPSEQKIRYRCCYRENDIRHDGDIKESKKAYMSGSGRLVLHSKCHGGTARTGATGSDIDDYVNRCRQFSWGARTVTACGEEYEGHSNNSASPHRVPQRQQVAEVALGSIRKVEALEVQ